MDLRRDQTGIANSRVEDGALTGATSVFEQRVGVWTKGRSDEERRTGCSFVLSVPGRGRVHVRLRWLTMICLVIVEGWLVRH
jgi:hypothetical protein